MPECELPSNRSFSKDLHLDCRHSASVASRRHDRPCCTPPRLLAAVVVPGGASPVLGMPRCRTMTRPIFLQLRPREEPPGSSKVQCGVLSYSPVLGNDTYRCSMRRTGWNSRHLEATTTVTASKPVTTPQKVAPGVVRQCGADADNE